MAALFPNYFRIFDITFIFESFHKNSYDTKTKFGKIWKMLQWINCIKQHKNFQVRPLIMAESFLLLLFFVGGGIVVVAVVFWLISRRKGGRVRRFATLFFYTLQPNSCQTWNSFFWLLYFPIIPRFQMKR